MTVRTTTLAELPGLAGTEIGTSDWLEIDQARIDRFADATDDHQWIHVDPARAADGPFGGTIAHGFLTLSLFIPLWSGLLEVTDATTLVNYGLDRVRFTSPVPAGSRVRLTAALDTVEPVARGGYQLGVSGVISIEGQERPAVVLAFLSRVS
ncbi:MaoC family dehydratase [Amnibacterium kyonggiense]|uniref:Acyl dehydratase n=1 Tax=Amnibacterium kyonggiense TaxID=595671 RepID=A0A4R7FEP8_9MICO|nr:MaoC family dehydratase [Amnibacterium kyonggiense]TDS74473.1 acyl dehydratase [Amnibacterium kyonggiense]